MFQSDGRPRSMEDFSVPSPDQAEFIAVPTELSTRAMAGKNLRENHSQAYRK